MPEATWKRNGTRANPSATKLLVEDHDAVREMKTRYEIPHLTSPEKHSLAHEVFLALEVHATIEEKIFYPAVAKALGREGERLVAEALEEHTEVKNAIAALKAEALGDTAFDERFMTMLADVEHHASEEEREMFPKVEDVLGEDVAAVGSQMVILKNTLLTAKAKAGAA